MLTRKDDIDYDIVEQLWWREANEFAKAKFGEEIYSEETRVTIFHYRDKTSKLIFNSYAIPNKDEREWLQYVTYPTLTQEEMEFLKIWNKELINKFLTTV